MSFVPHYRSLSSPDFSSKRQPAALRHSASEAKLALPTIRPPRPVLPECSCKPELPLSMRESSFPRTRLQWQHVITAFLAGILFAYAFLTISLRIVHPSSELGPGLQQESPWGPWVQSQAGRESFDCSRRLAATYSLAMGNYTAGSGQAAPDKLIIAARHDDDTTWLDLYLSHIPHVVYQVDDPENTVGAQHATLANKGNEAMGYLQFIIDYYDKLPASMVFLHGHRGTWHIKDHVPILQRLRWGQLPFANLRYANSPGDRLDWECGERTTIQEFKRFDCDWQGNHLRPRDMRPRKARELNAGNKDIWWDSIELREIWPDLYEAELGELPAELAAPCCAEFMVSRERVLGNPREFYTHMRDWIVETELGRYRSGRVFEYMWHVIFGEPHVIAPVAECKLLYCDSDALS